jgi:histidyl-tRNA synthetase
MGEAAAKKALSLAKELRDEGFWVEYDLMGRGLKAQMKYADKIGAAFSMVIGDNELENNGANLKNMRTGEQIPLRFDDGFIENFSNIVVGDMFSDTMNNI